VTADLLIRGARIIDPANCFDRVGELYVKEGYIWDLAPLDSGLPARQVLDAGGLILCPGLIDAHVHLRQPGGEHKETIATGTRAAVAGGFTAVCCMPNTDPPIDTPGRLAELQALIAQDAACRVYPLAAAIRDRDPTRLTDFAALKRAGAVAVTDDAMPLQEVAVMAQALVAAEAAQVPLVVHPELEAAGEPGIVSDPGLAAELNLPAVGVEREQQGIYAWRAAAARLKRPLDVRLHLAHLSSAAALQAFLDFCRDGRLASLTAETCPHYFILTAEALREHGADAKMNPPLRSAADVAAIRAALADGTIAVIATDHAPHAPAEKAAGIRQAPCGIIGLETAVGLVLTYLVHPGLLPLPAALAKMTAEPARILGLPGGRLAVGAPADLTLIDPHASWRVDPARFYSRSRNTPFAGWQLHGRPVMTFLQGRLVMRDGEVLI
jgi:dihydroorotase